MSDDVEPNPLCKQRTKREYIKLVLFHKFLHRITHSELFNDPKCKYYGRVRTLIDARKINSI